MSTDVTTTTDSETDDSDRRRNVAEAIAFLRSWSTGDDEDAQEQRESFTAIAKGVDEARRPYRTLFDGDHP